MQVKMLAKLNIPDKPGVYFFLDKNKILYIGKATSLKDRVRSYFAKDLIATRGPLIVDMVFKAKNIKWEVTDSVLEALILEANLIKKHQPYYNTKEKDDKSFYYIGITADEIPKVILVRGKELGKQKNIKNFYGPYPSGGQLKEALRIIRKIFPFYDDKSKNYKEFYKQIHLVPERREAVLSNIKHIKLFFEGKKKKIIFELKKEMMKKAKEKRFEEAGEIKRQIFALNHINDVALIKEDVTLNNFNAFKIEAYDVAHMSGKNMVGVMTVVTDGALDKKEYKKFKIKTQTDANDTGALLEILERRFAHGEWLYPRLIVVDGSTAQINTAKKVLSKMGIDIPVVSVVKDDKHKPLGIKGDMKYAKKYEREILLANSEAHRFAIKYHKEMRNKNFLR